MENQTPRGLRNCNPGNIRKSSDVYQGEKQPSSDKSFKQFKTMAYGYRAIFRILLTYGQRYRLLTIRQWIERWAPPEENDTDSYIGTVSDYSGISPDDKVDISNSELMCNIVAAISLVENGEDADMSDIEAGWRLL